MAGGGIGIQLPLDLIKVLLAKIERVSLTSIGE